MQFSPRDTIKEFFRRIASAASVEEIAELVREDVDWFVAGDSSVAPWVGRKIGRAGVAQFYAQLREEISSERFEVKDILSQGDRAVAIGELASRVRRTGKLIETEFVFDFTVENGLITRFRMFEDSLKVAQAAV